jgi:hypothetical protein
MHSANSWATSTGRRHFPPALKEQSCDFDLWFFLKLPPFICANGGKIAYKYLPFHFGLDTAESNSAVSTKPPSILKFEGLCFS